MPTLNWRCLPFDALHARTLYALLQLRTEVFVMEQACVFQDMDGADAQCFHLLGEHDGALQAYARLVPQGLKFNEASIGRVVTLPAARGGGLGHVLMREAVQALKGLWGDQPIRIGAQAHLEPFYRQHGFEPDGAIYIEDGIDHIEMLRA
ncbi:GNAT family N-acetyltransferase [Hydrogenophaga sp.]|uniref:GNAT family N-acetyltransferase n=1 Tax=Hydrogenophaga sp. TaxID=1904254 RepID=UPI00272726AB|nr:GNAT family N-acetyltransferase [Hydrogenophaga sp.]MDO9438799.1 GNAT family N-acetyltransferase [Hydrogenophaga sp.]